ncbi:MAG TPA: aldo/keto reductase [Thermoplasmata archaeon]
MVRACLAAGVSTFHAGTGPIGLVRARAIAVSLAAAPGPGSSIIVGATAELAARGSLQGLIPDLPPAGPSPDPRGTIAWHLELDPAQLGNADPGSVLRGLRGFVERGEVRSWGIGHSARIPSSDELRREGELDPGWMRLPFHLLATPAAFGAVTEAHRIGVPIVVDDPFAGGALNGRLLREGRVARAGAARPLDLAAVRSEWGPVISLGYLTSDGRRTLGQAALQFALETPGVVAVLADARDAAEVAELAHVPSLPSLGTEPRRRVEARMAGPAGRSNRPGEGARPSRV